MSMVYNKWQKTIPWGRKIIIHINNNFVKNNLMPYITLIYLIRIIRIASSHDKETRRTNTFSTKTIFIADRPYYFFFRLTGLISLQISLSSFRYDCGAIMSRLDFLCARTSMPCGHPAWELYKQRMLLWLCRGLQVHHDVVQLHQPQGTTISTCCVARRHITTSGDKCSMQGTVYSTNERRYYKRLFEGNKFK